MPLPEIKRCLICDDVRFEMFQKVSLIGVYGSTPDVLIYVTNFNASVRLCFAFLGSPGAGLASFRCQLKTLSGTPLTSNIIPPQVDFQASPMYSTMLAFWFDTVFPGPADYAVELSCNNHPSYRDAFRLAPAPPHMNPLTGLPALR
jgi:hypothetical protein